MTTNEFKLFSHVVSSTYTFKEPVSSDIMFQPIYP